MVGSIKWVLCGTEYRLQKIVQHYLQIGTGDFTPHSLGRHVGVFNT